MSGVGEALAGIAAAASFSQLFVYLSQALKVLARFCRDIEDAPSELRRVNLHLSRLYRGISFLRSTLNDIQDDELVPPELQVLLKDSLQDVENAIQLIRDKYLTNDLSVTKVKWRRVKFALTGSDNMRKLLMHLQDVETSLKLFTQLFELHISLLTHSSVQHKGIHLLASKGPVRNLNNCHNVNYNNLSSLRSSPSSYVLHVGSWLRTLGFYGSLNLLSKLENMNTVQLQAGYKLPAWIGKTISVYLQFAYQGWDFGSIYILPGYLRVQNQVPLTSPFMAACRRGDLQAMRQCLQDRVGGLNDRSVCGGKTPLLLAIESSLDSSKTEAVELLLNAGADPNVGDDEQILPVFAACGFRGIKRADEVPDSYIQCPPGLVAWLGILRLLVKHGASIHEVVSGYIMTTLNLSCKASRETVCGPSIVLPFFQLLLDESYTNFDIVCQRGLCALYTAIRSEGAAVRAIDVLARCGVQINKPLPDGRTALHLAAEIGSSSDPLEHLYRSYGMVDVNKQDQWGWTPLHYAVESYNNGKNDTCGKVKFLLEKGANPHIKGNGLINTLPHTSNCFKEPVSPLTYAEYLGPQIYERFKSNLVAIGHKTTEPDEECFYESQEMFEK